jgi:hypothetical protein
MRTQHKFSSDMTYFYMKKDSLKKWTCLKVKITY